MGLQLAAFYVHEHLRLTGKGRQAQIDKRLRTLLDWLHGQGYFVSAALVLQKTPRAVRSLKPESVTFRSEIC